MNKVKIITDSTCDLGAEILKELDVDFVQGYMEGYRIVTC